MRERQQKWIWLDMDGTIADLYGVEGWLEDLQAHMTRPYTEAKMMYDFCDLVPVLMGLKEVGFRIGIISWSAKNSTPTYDKAIEEAKKAWLIKNHLDMFFDEVIVTDYGIRKADTCREYGGGILVDDEKRNRDEWDLGYTINANEDIIKALQRIERMAFMLA